jgi:hypothetical protein
MARRLREPRCRRWRDAVVSRTCLALAEKQQLKYERLLEAYGNTTANASDGEAKALTVSVLTAEARWARGTKLGHDVAAG